jgi:hypothetical protein
VSSGYPCATKDNNNDDDDDDDDDDDTWLCVCCLLFYPCRALLRGPNGAGASNTLAVTGVTPPPSPLCPSFRSTSTPTECSVRGWLLPPSFRRVPSTVTRSELHCNYILSPPPPTQLGAHTFECTIVVAKRGSDQAYSHGGAQFTVDCKLIDRHADQPQGFRSSYVNSKLARGSAQIAT